MSGGGRGEGLIGKWREGGGRDEGIEREKDKMEKVRREGGGRG